MGYDQYTVPDTVSVEPAFVAFLEHSQTYVHGLSWHSFKFLWRKVNSKLPTIPFGIVACTFSDTTFLEMAVYKTELQASTMKYNEKCTEEEGATLKCLGFHTFSTYIWINFVQLNWSFVLHRIFHFFFYTIDVDVCRIVSLWVSIVWEDLNCTSKITLTLLSESHELHITSDSYLVRAVLYNVFTSGGSRGGSSGTHRLKFLQLQDHISLFNWLIFFF